MSDVVTTSSDRTQIQEQITDYMSSVLELTQSVLSSAVLTTDSTDEAHHNLKEFMNNTLSALVSLNDHALVMPSTIYMTKRMLYRTEKSDSEYQKLQDEADNNIDDYIRDYFNQSLSHVSLLNYELSRYTTKSTQEDIDDIVKQLGYIEESSSILLYRDTEDADFDTLVCCSDENKLIKLLKYLDILENIYVISKNAADVLRSSSFSPSTKLSRLSGYSMTDFSDILKGSPDSFVSVSKTRQTVYAVTNYMAMTMTDGRVVVIDKETDSVVDIFSDNAELDKVYYIPE